MSNQPKLYSTEFISFTYEEKNDEYVTKEVIIHQYLNCKIINCIFKKYKIDQLIDQISVIHNSEKQLTIEYSFETADGDEIEL